MVTGSPLRPRRRSVPKAVQRFHHVRSTGFIRTAAIAFLSGSPTLWSRQRHRLNPQPEAEPRGPIPSSPARGKFLHLRQATAIRHGCRNRVPRKRCRPSTSAKDHVLGGKRVRAHRNARSSAIAAPPCYGRLLPRNPCTPQRAGSAIFSRQKNSGPKAAIP